MAEKLLYECDCCKKQTISNNLPSTWNEITYSWESRTKPIERKSIGYHVCRPECHLKILDKCVTQAYQHSNVTISDMPVAFARKLLNLIFGNYVAEDELCNCQGEQIISGNPIKIDFLNLIQS